MDFFSDFEILKSNFEGKLSKVCQKREKKDQNQEIKPSFHLLG